MSFDDGIPHIDRLKSFYQQISTDHLGELTENQLAIIRQDADAIYSLLSEIDKFDPELDGAASTRKSIIQRLESSYATSFNILFQIISYLASRERDFSALERQARAAAQAATDEASKLKKMLEETDSETKRILLDVRQAAAEQGVTQQAIYFKDEADLHQIEAAKWQGYTVKTAIGLGAYAVFTLFLTEIPLFKPENAYEAAQLAISKVLIFSVIAYMLFLSARTLLAHRHNAIVNRHRQNALLTFNALADATGGEERRDIVLTHASSCIFSPQETGYSKGTQASSGGGSQLIEVLPKIIHQAPAE